MTLEQQHFRLTSPAFEDNGMMAVTHAGKNPKNPNCIGENVSPPLEWFNPPVGTESFALLMFDQEGQNGLGVSHWVAYNIPTIINGLPEGSAASPDRPFINGLNFLGEASYYGGCPPKGTGPHHYVFTLIATRIPMNRLQPGLDMPRLLEAIGADALAATGLVGRFGH